jgi:GWxTD domain-containing protein
VVIAVGATLATLTGGCAGRRYDRDLPGSARSWIEGPVRWLVLPEEARRFRRLDTSAEALAFIEQFWKRRDPDPQTAGNPFAQQFFERVQSADLLYGGARRRGSLTDRGGATVLLGSPSVLRYTQQRAPTWEPGSTRRRSGTGVRRIRVEVWGYDAENLSPRLVELLEEEGIEPPVELTFVEEADRSRLVAGDEILELAARAAVRE